MGEDILEGVGGVKKRSATRAGCVAAAEVRSLATFAKNRPKNTGGIKCFTCSLPPHILAQVNKAHRDGVSRATIWQWLITAGYKIRTSHTIGNHFRNRHEVLGAQ